MESKKNKEMMREIYTQLKKNNSTLIEIKEMANFLLDAEKSRQDKDALQFKKDNEYEKLLLNNITSRISILEEEAESYKRE